MHAAAERRCKMKMTQAEFDAAYGPFRNAQAVIGMVNAMAQAILESGPSEAFRDNVRQFGDLAVAVNVAYDLIDEGLSALCELEVAGGNSDEGDAA